VLFNAFDETTLSPELHAELGKVLACRAARFNQDWSGIDFGHLGMPPGRKQTSFSKSTLQL